MACGLSHRQVAKSVRVSAGTVGEVVARAKLALLDWATVESLREDALDLALYGKPQVGEVTRPVPDAVNLLTELRRKVRDARAVARGVPFTSNARERRPIAAILDRDALSQRMLHRAVRFELVLRAGVVRERDASLVERDALA